MSEDFESRVRSRLRERAEPTPNDLAEVRSFIASLPEGRSGFSTGWLRLAVNLVGVAAVALAGVVFVAGLSLRSQPSPSSGPAGRSSAGTPTPTASQAGPVSISWQLVAPGAAIERATMGGVVAFDNGFIAVGGQDNRATVWSSSDGRDWTAHSIASAPSLAASVALTANGSLVAFGITANRPTVWLSPDGLTWTASALPAPAWNEPVADWGSIASGPAGLLVLGRYEVETGGGPAPSGFGPLTPILWWSADGKRWVNVAFPVAGVQLQSVASFDGGFLVGGARREGALWVPAIWISSDGRSWTASTIPPTKGSESGYYMVTTAFAAGPYGILAANCITAGSGSAVWQSKDGRTWSAAADVGDPNENVLILAWARDRFVAVGVRSRDPASASADAVTIVSESTDGTSWETVASIPSGRARPTSIGVGDTRLVVVGWGGGAGDAALVVVGSLLQ